MEFETLCCLLKDLIYLASGIGVSYNVDQTLANFDYCFRCQKYDPNKPYSRNLTSITPTLNRSGLNARQVRLSANLIRSKLCQTSKETLFTL